MKRAAARLSVIFIAFVIAIAFMPVPGGSFSYAGIGSAANIEAESDTDSTGNYVHVKWTPNGGGSYNVYRSDESVEEPVLIAKNVNRECYDRDPALISGKEYVYLVVYLSSGEEDWGQTEYISFAPTFKEPEPDPGSGDSGSGSGSGGSGSGSGGSGSGGSGDSGSGSGGSGDSGSGSGGSGAGGSGGSGDSGSGGSSGTQQVDYPSNNDVKVSVRSSVPGTVDVAYITTSDERAIFGIQMEYNGKVIIDADSFGSYSSTSELKIPYGKSVTLRYRVYRTNTFNADKKTRVYAKSWKNIKNVKSVKLKRPALKVTKISSSRAGLSWTASPGATGYKIYKGNKLVKTLKGSKTKYIYKKAGAGSAKYAVQPVIKNSLMKNAASGPKSKLRKGTANKRKYNYTTRVDSIKYANIRYSISQISLKGNTYTVTGYVLNNRIFALEKFRKLEITIYCDGKVMAKKTFNNLKCYVKKGDYRKFTVKVKGKGGVDFANSEGNTYYATWEPYWKGVGGSK